MILKIYLIEINNLKQKYRKKRKKRKKGGEENV